MIKNRFKPSAFQIISAGYLLLILLGSLLLMLPVSSAGRGSATFFDSFFTATSAVCVTGLIVRDTALHWSEFGQFIIMLLIQIGGMGVITVALMFSFLSGKKIGLKQRSIMQEAISAPQLGGIVRLTKFIIITTFLSEIIGALLLLPRFLKIMPFPRALFSSLFTSVSAFCNAGFDVMGKSGGEFSSLTLFSSDYLVNAVVMFLIIFGGIGFLTWDDFKTHKFKIKKYRMQSKVILLLTLLFILIPAIWFFFFECKNMPTGKRIIASLFQSVTLRTAGFNTVDLSAMSGSGKTLMIIFMLIGGAPGSTAGGVKITTVAVLALTVRAVFKRDTSVTCFGRKISDETVRNAITLFMMYFFMFATGGIIISAVEHLPILTCLFETASAAGTVGLTLGITGGLHAVSRIILIILMIFGRVGGLTLIYASSATPNPEKGDLPYEKISVG
ncbi:MAG: Trk family potassium uptake protein [Clostridia bacterium]|nr:Trk family potassium uptake protein [Clostridia bacterium]